MHAMQCSKAAAARTNYASMCQQKLAYLSQFPTSLNMNVAHYVHCSTFGGSECAINVSCIPSISHSS